MLSRNSSIKPGDGWIRPAEFPVESPGEMVTINTTLGEIDPADLGRVDVHEHLIIDCSSNPLIPADFNHIDMELIAEEMAQWKQAGGGTIIDCSPIGAGRNILLLEQASQKAALPVVVSSGFHKLAYYPKNHWLFSQTQEAIHALLCTECTQGVLINDHKPDSSQRSSTKAGILKFGIGAEGFLAPLDNLLSALAQTLDSLGVNAMVHTEPGVPFAQLLQRFDENRISPERIILCHMGKQQDLQLLKALAKEGFFLEFDDAVRSPSPDNLATTILDLFEEGYGHQVLFAGDLARRSYWRCFGGAPGLAYLITGLTEELIALGLTREMLEQIWTKNPQSFFGLN